MEWGKLLTIEIGIQHDLDVFLAVQQHVALAREAHDARRLWIVRARLNSLH